MIIPSAWPQVLDFFGTPAPGQLSSNAGLLPVCPYDLAWDSAELSPTPSTIP
jgi:hypothetical protein